MNSINKSRDIFTVIDVGNSKVSCLIGSSVRTNNVQIKALGFGQHASFGMSNGQVTDMKEIANSIARAVEKLGAIIITGCSVRGIETSG